MDGDSDYKKREESSTGGYEGINRMATDSCISGENEIEGYVSHKYSKAGC